MNPTNSFFHSAYPHYDYQPLNQQDCIAEQATVATTKTERKNPYNEPAPLAACRTGNLDWLNEELAHNPSIVHLDYRSGRTGHTLPLLFIAAQEGYSELAMRLIEKGADVNHTTQDEDGATPLFIAAQEGHIELVKRLIEEGADVNCTRKHDAATPLLTAAYNGRTELVEWLFKKGADINHPRKDGTTALFFANQNGHSGIVRFLLEAGADPAKQGQPLASPRYTARHATQDRSMSAVNKTVLKLRSIAAAKYNPYNEAAPMAACRTGNLRWLNEEIAKDSSIIFRNYKSKKSGRFVPLLTTAAKQGHVNIVKRMLELGADANCSRAESRIPIMRFKDKGYTPLALAAEKGHLGIVNLLLEHGARVNQSNSCGSTALNFAASYGHLAVVKRLVSQGADINRATTDGATPLFFAVQGGHKRVVKYLLEVGADPEKEFQVFGQLLQISPRTSAIIDAHDFSMYRMLNKAIKQRSVLRTSSQECLVIANQDAINSDAI